jgi:hypothetical protein
MQRIRLANRWLARVSRHVSEATVALRNRLSGDSVGRMFVIPLERVGVPVRGIQSHSELALATWHRVSRQRSRPSRNGTCNALHAGARFQVGIGAVELRGLLRPLFANGRA